MSEQGFSVKISARIDSYLAAMEAAKKATRQLATEGSAMSGALGKSIQGLAPHMQKVGRFMSTHVTLPVVAAGGAAVKMSLDFDGAFTKMQSLAGVTSEEVDGLKDSVLRLAGQTAKSPQELAEALYFLRSSGLDAGEAMEALDASAKASAAGLGNTATIADAVSSAMNAYAQSGLDAAEATDILVATARAGKAEPEQLAGALGRVLPISSELGVSFKDVGGAIASLSLTGNDASTSATLLTNVLSKMLKPSQQGAEALAEVGMSTDTIRASIAERGLLATLEDLRASLGDAGFNRFLEDAQAVQGALSLTGQNAEQVGLTFDSVADSVGATGEAFATASESDGFRMRQAWVDVQTALIQAGDVIVPIVAGVAGAVADLVDGFTGMSDGAQTAVLITLGAFAAIGPIASVVGGIIKNIAILKTVMATISAHPMILAGIAVAGVATALMLHKSESEKAAERAQQFYDTVAGGLDTLDAQEIALLDAGAAAAKYMEQVLGPADKALRDKITANQDYVDVMNQVGIQMGDLMRINRGGVQADNALIEVRRKLIESGKLQLDVGHEVWRADMDAAEAQAYLTAETEKYIQTGKVSDMTGYINSIDGGVQASLGFVDVLQDQAAAAKDAAEAQADIARTGDIAAIQYLKTTGQMGLLTEAEQAAAEAALDIAAAVGAGTGRFDLWSKVVGGSGKAAEQTAGFVGDLSDALGLAGGAADHTYGFIDHLTDLFGDAAPAVELTAEELDAAEEEMRANEAAAKNLITQIAKSTTVFDQLRTAANMLDAALGAVTGGQMTLETSTRTLYANMDSLKTRVDEAKTAEDAYALSLDIATESGRKNREDIQGQAQAILEHGAALVQSGVSIGDAATEVNKLTADFEAQLVAMGFSQAEVDAYLTTLGMTPESVSTAIELVNDEWAKQRLTDLLEQLGGIDAGAEATIRALIDTKAYDEAERLIAFLARGRSIDLWLNAPRNAPTPRSGIVQSAGGRYVAGGTNLYSSLGETPGRAGDEVVLPLGNEPAMRGLLAMPGVGDRVTSALEPWQRYTSAHMVAANQTAYHTSSSSVSYDQRQEVNIHQAVLSVDQMARALTYARLSR